MKSIDHIIIKYLSRTASEEEQGVLLTWLEEDEDNGKYFRSIKNAYDLGQLKEHLKESRREEEWEKLKRKIQVGKMTSHSSLYILLRYAAIFLLGWFGLQTFQHFTQPEEKITRTLIEAGIGESATITLPDNSTVWLNACSSVSYDNTYGISDRRIQLLGEAFFEVTGDSLKPFLVQSDRFTYRVTGTSFNVYSFAEDNEISIALLEGGVTIEYNGHAVPLCPGEIFIFNKENGKAVRKKTDVNRLSDWRNGGVSFENMTFEELTRRLARKFNVTFVFEKENMKNEIFGGFFYKHESLETVLKVISTSIPMQYEVKEGVVYIK